MSSKSENISFTTEAILEILGCKGYLKMRVYYCSPDETLMVDHDMKKESVIWPQ